MKFSENFSLSFSVQFVLLYLFISLNKLYTESLTAPLNSVKFISYVLFAKIDELKKRNKIIIFLLIYFVKK